MENKMPKWNELFLPVIKFYSDGKEHINREAKVKIADTLNLSEELRNEKTELHKENKIEGRVGWALSALKIAGILEQYERGSFKITKLGMELLKKLPTNLDEQYLIDNYPTYKKNKEVNISNRKSKDKKENIDNYTPNERIDNAINELEEKLSNDLIEKLYIVDPYRFEEIVADLLDKMGYGDLVVTQKSNDGGIDAIVNEDKWGWDKILIQAKRYNSDNIIHEKLIRDFVGALSIKKVQKGIFVSTSTFDKKAIEAAKNSDKKIVLIDGKKLTELMIEYNIGTTIVESYSIKNLDTDYFDN